MSYNYLKIGERIFQESKNLWVQVKSKGKEKVYVRNNTCNNSTGTLQYGIIFRRAIYPEQLNIDFKKWKEEGFKKVGRDDLITICKENYSLNLSTNQITDIWNGRFEKYDLPMLKTFSSLFDCEIGYLLCEEGYEYRKRSIKDFSEETGLKPEAVAWIQYIMSHGSFEAIQGVLKQKEEQFNPDNKDKYEFIYGEYSAMKKEYEAMPIRLSQLLNDFIMSGAMDSFLKSLRDYVMPKYTIPVYVDEEGKNVFTSPCTPLSYDKKKDKLVNCLRLADPSSLSSIYGSTPRKNADYVMIPLNDSYMQRVALDDITKTLNNFSEDFNKDYDPKAFRIDPKELQENKNNKKADAK